MTSCFPSNFTTASSFLHDAIMEDLTRETDDPKRVLVVIDALKDFSVDFVECVLRNFTFRDSCTITLLGIRPFLNIPLSSKTWSDIWSMKLGDLSNLDEKTVFKNDTKCQKVKRLIELCQNYGVALEIKTETGHLLRLRVVEHISSLHASLVVFDRNHSKNFIEYCAEKVPCHMIVMNDNGKVYLIKKRKLRADNSATSESSCSISQRSHSRFSERLKRCISRKSQRRRHWSSSEAV